MKLKTGYSEIEKKVEAAVAEAIVSAGYEIWDISYSRSGGGNVLEITIDSEDGIGIDDCERVSRLVDPLLDAADPIPVSYTLNVSSPGIERDLTLPRHFDFCTGEEAELKFFRPLPQTGSKKLTGRLSGYSAQTGEVSIFSDGKEYSIPFSAICSARLVYDFSADVSGQGGND